MGEWVTRTIIGDYIGTTIGIHSLLRTRQKNVNNFADCASGTALPEQMRLLLLLRRLGCYSSYEDDTGDDDCADDGDEDDADNYDDHHGHHQQ